MNKPANSGLEEENSRSAVPKRVKRGRLWCRGWESIPRPRAYESPALPLSYLGKRAGYYYEETILSTISEKKEGK
jgi:hypothetical protein